MNQTELETWIELTFYPPRDSPEYIDRIPAAVQQQVLALTTQRWSADTTERERIQHLFTLYTHEAGITGTFWLALRDLLRDHYTANP